MGKDIEFGKGYPLLDDIDYSLADLSSAEQVVILYSVTQSTNHIKRAAHELLFRQ